ncbi:MAG TPA: BatA domain-containing protein [Methylomirabilota bacterium]|nr:BatA domain-containing protein [Methylomirabilota bacterium]
MSFLTPLFLLGGLAIAGPIIYHLIRHITRQRVQFSSLLFLEQSPPQITRKSRLQDIFLLILRCLVIAALALAFARPYVQKSLALPTTKGTHKRIVALVDTSASMRRADLWTKARSELDKVVSSTRPEDELAVLTFDRTSTALLRLEESRALPVGERKARLQQQLANIKPSWNTGHYGNAVAAAVELLHEAAMNDADAEQLIYLITDFQEGGRLDGLQGLEWPKNTRVSLVNLETSASNASLTVLAEAGAPSGAKGGRVRVHNSGDSRKEQFKLGWAVPGALTHLGKPLDVYVAPGKSQTVTVPERPSSNGPVSLLLTGDDHLFDNQLFVAAAAQQNVSVLYFGGDDPKDTAQPLYYLQRALEQDPRQKIVVTNLIRPPAPEQLQNAGLVVVAGQMPDDAVAPLAAAITTGKTVLLMLRSPEMGPLLARLAPDAKLTVQNGPTKDALFGQISFDHPLFAPFADPRFSDFTKIRFWKRRAVSLDSGSNARVIARFDDNSPAILHAPVGQGSIFILASGWQPADSQLALSSKFVPLLYGMLDHSGAVRSGTTEVRVGEALPLPKGRGEARVRVPSGEVKIVPADAAFTDTATPGIYVMEGTPPLEFAVNMDPSEGRTKPRTLEELERMGVPIKEQPPAISPATVKSEKNLMAVELENRQKMWRWFLVAAVAGLLLESAIAGWKTLKRSSGESAATA